MDKNKLEIEAYKKQIELFLGTLEIYRGTKIINKDSNLNKENKQFLKEHFAKMLSGNFDEKLFDQALDELIPYLYEVNPK